MPPLDSDTFERLAGEHLEAWQGLLRSTATVASLPWLTVAELAGWPLAAPEGPGAQRTAAEAEALRAALETEREARRAEAEASRSRHAAQEALIRELREAYARLERAEAAHAVQARHDWRLGLYQALEPLLTQLPLVRHAAAEGREVAASDVLALLGPLDRAVAEQGFEAIGAVGEAVAFDPQRHQPARGAIAPGEAVTVRHVGYRLGEQILRRARVSRAAEPAADGP